MVEPLENLIAKRKACEAQVRSLQMPRQRGYLGVVKDRLAEIDQQIAYPNVTRAEWSAMSARSAALQREATALRRMGKEAEADLIYKSLQPLHEHMRAISHLTPLDGPTPR